MLHDAHHEFVFNNFFLFFIPAGKSGTLKKFNPAVQTA